MSFLLSVPSYVIPGTWLQNIEFLAKRPDIQAIELLLFLWDDSIKQDFTREIDAIRHYAQRFLFTVHLPEAEPEILREIIELTHEFTALYCIHPPKNREASTIFAASIVELENDFKRSLMIENTTLNAMEAALECLHTASPHTVHTLCMDTAHLLAEGQSPIQFIKTYGTQIKEIHLNDYWQQKSHAPISPNSDWILPCLPFFLQFEGILEFELFDIQAIDASLNYFNVLMKG